MTPEELNAIRERCEKGFSGNWLFLPEDVRALLAEVERLRAERDQPTDPGAFICEGCRFVRSGYSYGSLSDQGVRRQWCKECSPKAARLALESELADMRRSKRHAQERLEDIEKGIAVLQRQLSEKSAKATP